MKKFAIPDKLTPINAINCAKYIKNSPPETKYIYDFSQMQHCHPFGLLVLGNAIRYNRYHYKKALHECVGVNYTQGTELAADLGFFQYAGWEIGRKTSIEDYGANHIPVKEITIADLQSQDKSTYVLGNLIERQANDLAYTLTQRTNSEATKTLSYCLREMIRNSFEHGNTEKVWICGLYWPTRSEAEIAILDEGQGIWGSLRKNRNYRLKSDSEANKIALQPGVSRMFGKEQDPYDIWQNSGYGLYMASALCGLEGYFILASGADATLVNSDNQQNYVADISGTAICLNIRTDEINSLQEKLDALSALGQEKARENAQHSFITASKVSTIASLITKLDKDK